MSSLVGSLPRPVHSGQNTTSHVEETVERRLVSSSGVNRAPPYGSRKSWIPRTQEDYGDGGAFPEIHVAQYPLEMGRKSSSGTKTVPLTLDSEGKIKYDAILGHNSGAIVQSRYQDMVAKKFDEEDLKRPDPEKEAETTEKTKAALEGTSNSKIAASKATAVARINAEPTYIRYNPSQQGASFNSGAQSRIIRMTQVASDPLEPPKFKTKKVPNGPPSPPAPVMHSPPRKLTLKDQQDWKIPPCISNWKNNKGYTIPLDKRLAADGRGLQEHVINDNFAKLSESLYIAERVAREEVSKRSEIEKRLALKEKEKKEEMLKKLAQEARLERAASQASTIEDEETEKERRDRDEIRNDRRKNLERDLRMQRNRSAIARNEERDISEKIALGMTVPTKSSETMFDQRLFNQTQGINSGFGDDDSYNVYNKPLFQASSANAVYRPKKATDEEAYGGEEDYKKLQDTSKFQPDKGFSGAKLEKGQQPRDKPVEFEKKPEEDPFGLDEFLSAAKKKGKPLDNIGTSGQMNASAGNASSEPGGKRKIDFESSSNRNKSQKR